MIDSTQIVPGYLTAMARSQGAGAHANPRWELAITLSSDVAYASLQPLQQQLVIAAVLAFGLSLVLGIVIPRGSVRAISQLVLAAEQAK